MLLINILEVLEECSTCSVSHHLFLIIPKHNLPAISAISAVDGEHMMLEILSNRYSRLNN